jgi:hypothetical protein
MAQHMVAGDPADEVTAHGGGDPDLVNQSIEE